MLSAVALESVPTGDIFSFILTCVLATGSSVAAQAISLVRTRVSSCQPNIYFYYLCFK